MGKCMTANELAILLEVDSWYKLVTREEIATMLRQQQAEIEALKLQVKGYQTSTKHYRKKADGDDDWELTREYCS